MSYRKLGVYWRTWQHTWSLLRFLLPLLPTRSGQGLFRTEAPTQAKKLLKPENLHSGAGRWWWDCAEDPTLPESDAEADSDADTCSNSDAGSV